ncbi:hypothetical protein QYE76_032604 [Lolium multiflorum]|uniref:Uncharacterized protein n=1 Tax=Lolium multiflorum TaxID=4521 RepID=A0AAD8VKS1_LOLMU|nr:hypothetical protein QYE76_032604 [Lolium multiflorum]
MAESFNANTEVSGLKNHIPNFPRLATRTFPDATGKQIRCTSYGQALYSLPGSKLIPQEASEWFSVFFQGLDNPLFFPYTESEHFENPVLFRLDSFADDTSTRQLYSIMIRPCFLPVGMSTSNRIIKPGYESYQPVVAARQFGLGQVSPHFFLHFLTESRADLPDVLTSQRCYSFFDALVIPIPHNLSFTSSTDDFEAWWAMWKTHAFRRALGPLLKQLDAEYDIPAEQQQDGPEPVHDDGSPFTFLPPAPVVLFCKNSPSLKKVVMQSQPILPKSASKAECLLGQLPPEPQREQQRKVAARKTLRRHTSSPAQEIPHTSTQEISSEDTQSGREDSSSGTPGEHHTEPARLATVGFQEKTDDTSSGEVKEVVMPSTTLDLATSQSVADKAATLAKPPAETQEPITSSSAAPMVLGELKALLSSSIETLVEDTEGIKSILEDLQPHLPVTLQVKLWPVVTLSAYRSRVTLARQRIGLRHAQLPLKADIADKCQRLNEKKAALDAKTDTSTSTAELEILRKELEDLEERVRVTKQLIQDKEALIARSHEEAEGLKAELKTDLAEIRALNKQLVTGQDEDDEAEIAEVDRVRASALCALEAFLQ